MVPSVVDSDVDVDDVATLQLVAVGHAMTDHLVDRGTHRFRKTVVVQRRRVTFPIEASLVHHRVDLIAADTRLRCQTGDVEHLAPQPPR